MEQHLHEGGCTSMQQIGWNRGLTLVPMSIIGIGTRVFCCINIYINSFASIN